MKHILAIALFLVGCSKTSTPPPAETEKAPEAAKPVAVAPADTQPESREEVCCDVEGAGPSWMDPTECHVNNAKVLPESSCKEQSADMPVEQEGGGKP